MIYNIVVVADEEYIQHTGVMLHSLFCHNARKKFMIYFLTTAISDASKQKMDELCHAFQANIEYLICSLDDISDLPCGMWTPFIYLKLFIPQVLLSNINRCLFLDGDMIIYDDIDELYNIEMNGYVIAAVEDNPDGEYHKKRLGLSQNDIYINSGVMVCNLKLWREQQDARDIFDYARYISNRIFNEQDVIACYFRGKIKLLPIRWNMVTHYFLKQPKIYDHYKAELSKARKHPGIIHFCAPIKPWFSDCDHPYGKLYKKYLKRTPWEYYVFPEYESLSVFKKIKKRIKRMLNNIGFRHDPMAFTLK